MSEQHYRMTLEDAIAHYQTGDLTAKGLLHIYLKIRLKPGWVLKETQKEICDCLGISRAAFYSGLSRLKAEGSINWSAPSNTRFSISLAVCERGHQSTIVDEQSTIVDEQSTIVDEQSTIVENKSPEVPSNKDSSDSPNLYSNSFQLFINSLSDSERESFLKFAEEKAKAMPNRPQLIDAWIAKHYLDLYKQFLASAAGREAKKEAIARQYDWPNDPRFNDWIWKSFRGGYLWTQEDEAEREDRYAFYTWAQDTNAYEGICYE